jgi:hypothetical protein
MENNKLGVAVSSGGRATGLRPQPASQSSQSSVPNAVRHLEEYADGLEVAADCERRIFAAYKPEWDRWEQRNTDPEWKSSDNLNRMMRNALEARSNAARIGKDAAAIRTVLAVVEQLRETIVELWHETEAAREPLPHYLGMTEAEYAEWAVPGSAQGGEARQGGDACGSVHEHPVAEGDAPKGSEQ